jgi:transcriptional regulator with XRE-family HTH domain
VENLNIRKKLGLRVKELRAVTGLSQEAFADKCGFARSYMSRVERGGANPSVDALEVLAIALGVQVKDLFNDTKPKATKKAPAHLSWVPFAADGSHFGPHLKQAQGFTVGDKEDETCFADYEEALLYLRGMGIAKWRRPNTNGNWGVVSAVRWSVVPPSNSR